MTKEDFADIYVEFSPRLYRYVFHRVDDHAVSEDLISQVFFKALKNIKKFDAEKGNVSTWLYTIASHAVIDFYRRDETCESLDDYGDRLSFQERHGDRMDSEIRLEKVLGALKKLPLKTQEIITLRIFAELPFAEIAKIVGIGESGVKMGFVRGVEIIRNSMNLIVALLVLLLN